MSTTSIGIGFSKNLDPQIAAREAAFQAKTMLGKDKIDFAMVFSSIHYAPERLLPVINTILNNPKLIGCSTAGIIINDTSENRGVGVCVMNSQDIKFGIGSINNLNIPKADQMANLLAKNCMTELTNTTRHAMILLADGQLKNIATLLEGLQTIFGSAFPLIGGGSCDDFYFGNTFQMFQNKALQYCTSAVIFGGHMQVGIGVRHGWKPLGKPHTISDASGHVINKIDDKKAIKFYEDYFGAGAKDIHSSQIGQIALLYPIGLFIPGNREALLRNAVDIMEDGSIVCQGDIPIDAEAHIMIGNKEYCKKAAFDAAQEAYNNLLGKKAKVIFIFECMSRLKLMGRSAPQEIQEVRRIFGNDVPIFGMYTNGEYAPFQEIERAKKTRQLNGSIVVFAIS